MAPEQKPELEELNKRRVERRQRSQARQRKRRVTLAVVCLLAAALGLGVFFLSRQAGENKQAAYTETQSGNTVAEPETVIHLVAGGDVNVTDAVVASGGSAYDYSKTFLDISPLLAEGDLTVVNFEGNLFGSPYGSKSSSAPQSMAEILHNSGVDLVQLANSYSIYQGVSGLQTTIQSVKEAGMEPLGVYGDQRAARAGKGYTIRDVKGIKIAFVAFTKGMDGMTLPKGSEHCVNVLYKDYDSTYQKVDTAAIERVLSAVEKEKPDLTVAMLHWGSEYNDTVSKSQKEIVELMQSMGVDAIIGTHPHFVHKMTYDETTGNFVAYSLGDLISDGKRSGTEYSVILNLEITKNQNGTRITGYTYTPIFTVAERGRALCSMRIQEAMTAYERNYMDKVQDSTYESMKYALQRIEARVKGE